ncbi:tetratricopeptide repeat protein [Shewanella fidelis]|uniref:Tetratricopeptide repeat protein n=1 Tax=Shewanella fidelis TaxID=173509 RepID=A0AAW8NII0_9GAMM|nr:tetratricopeptide repeat protein [Shewanella fidelis]MDR8522988.1 tetratricopeptide repeat protein [Shewanella fidelis]MDW4811686.1 tetratricopeptide repeat protein [Shewanella fidelis]MDW4815807.1 tetratricopeptide repeat protein [Shewanella fidelis]MDW4819897.1 tetratricopeptide repeat protein [Shewanella fidelis]MDW4824129.1 tetratricopeptide repeat protein [Shewanella fidelis]
MHIFITLLFSLTLSLISNTVSASTNDDVLAEIQFRENPKVLAQNIENTIPSLPGFTDLAQFNAFAKRHLLSAAELQRNIQLAARLKMDLSDKSKDRYLVANNLIQQLEHISHSDFDKSYLLMLKGRYVGRSQQDFKQAIEYYQQAIPLVELSSKSADQVLLYTLYEHISVIHMIMRETDTALKYLQKLSATAQKIENDYLIAHAESLLGKYFYKQNQIGKALSHYTAAIKYSRGGNNPSQNAHIELQLARVYRDIESWDEALTSANNAVESFTLLGNDNYVSSAMTVIAMIYANQEQWYQAIDYYLNAQQIEIRLGNETGLALNQHNLGEAYFKIGDIDNSLSYLKLANAIFTKKNSEHYLVYNDLLIAEVSASKGNWRDVEEYATKAEKIAESKQLPKEQSEALERIATAQEHLGKYEQAYKNMLKLNSIRSVATPSENELDLKQSKIKQQKLNLKLSQVEKQLQQKAEQLNIAHLTSLICMFLLSLLGLLLVKQWRLKNKANQLNDTLQQTRLLEPFTQLPNFLSFKYDYNNASQTQIKTLALICLSDQVNDDLYQGYEGCANMHKRQLLAFKSSLNCQGYLIRPGMFLLSFDNNIAAPQLLAQLRESLDKNQWQTNLHMGILHLPLLADPAIKLTASQHFTTLQMMLYGARTLGFNQDYFVTMKTLNFASAGIFSKPIYLNIEKSIVRGIVKIETNGNKDDILWPKWKNHQNIDINDDKVAS